MAKRKKKTEQVVIESEFDAPVENKQDDTVNTIAEDFKAPADALSVTEDESNVYKKPLLNHSYNRPVRRL